MDDLLKAVTGLINTGGALADDALYLFFIFKAIESISFAIAWPTSIYVLTRGIALCIKTGWEGSNKNQ